LEILKVSATSKLGAGAGAIAGVVRSQHKVEVQAIGPGAINQAIKAIAISRGYVASRGLDLVCIPPSSPYRSTGRSGPASASSSKRASRCPQRRNEFSAIDALEHSIALVR
jgi:stage V sporulation protein S